MNILLNPSARYQKKSDAQICQDARALQQQLGWDDMVSLQDLQKFVQVYPEYRLSCLFASCNRNSEYTYEGSDFDATVLREDTRTITTQESKVLYLWYEPQSQHYVAIRSPLSMYKELRKTNSIKFCHVCVEICKDVVEHSCEARATGQEQVKVKRKRKCEFCGVYSDRCICASTRCGQCKAKRTRGYDSDHRCIVTKTTERPKNKQEYFTGGIADGSSYALWAYDFEARLEIRPHIFETIQEFEIDEDQFTGSISVLEFSVKEHKVNLVVARNVFTNEEKIFRGDQGLRDFIWFMHTFNSGKNLCFAHNASGYDTRLLFEEACTMNDLDVSMEPILRGGKFMQLKLGNAIYRDSLLHVTGSLRDLAKDFCGDAMLEKGHFPHLFNTVENYNYEGPIPDRKYFDLSFSMRNDKDLQDFELWYATWVDRTDWNFQQELEKYCINDVLVLSEIMKSYHTILFDKFEMSPWHNTTAPSYVHEVYLRKLALTLELPDPKEEELEYAQRIQELAWNEYWAVLTETEYWFARKALRGGRTDIRKVYHKVSQEDWERGVRIRYQDICSQYPYQQAVHDFPVGLPTIYVWDRRDMPCMDHKKGNCTCSNPLLDRSVHCITDAIEPNAQDILGEDWFGIVCASVEPPSNLYHPVLVHWDEDRGKSIADCYRIERGVFTSVELQQALRVGYTLIKIHRFDKYKKRPSLWADTIKDLFIEKMVNSSRMPSLEDQQRLVREYEAQFGMGDALRKTFLEERWGKNPAKKKTFKIMLNSGWGKHAQRPIMTEAKIFDMAQQEEQVFTFFQNCTSGQYQFQDCTVMGNKNMYRYIQDGKDTHPDLHSCYLPAALFVPAYGRLHLWNQLHKLGKRVLMNDTDSIVYLYDPQEYNIPQGDVWGQWEVEDVDSKNGGIHTFVGLGPKTYAIKCANGETLVKCKGLSLKHATRQLVNFDSMEKLVLDYLNHSETRSIKVPQTVFVYRFGQGMHTYKMLKDLAFSPDDLKGYLDDQGHLYPFGYQE